MTDQTALPPPVMWAQRAPVVFLTINLEDVKDPVIKVSKDSIYFKGVGGLEKKLHEVTIPLYKEIDADKSKYFNRGRCIEFILAKANPEDSYWPALTSDKKKHHWVKCDFNKWADEDDSAEEGGMGGGGGGDFEDMMREMGGLGMGGSGKPDFSLNDAGDGTDSDDEPIPDLE